MATPASVADELRSLVAAIESTPIAEHTEEQGERIAGRLEALAATVILADAPR